MSSILDSKNRFIIQYFYFLSKNKDVIIFRYLNDTKLEYQTGSKVVKSIKYGPTKTVEENKKELFTALRKCQNENARYPSVKAICSTYGKWNYDNLW